MKGRWIYAAAASLLGNLTSLLHPAIAIIFSLLALFLLKRNILTKNNMTILILIYIVLIIRSELAADYNRTSLTGNEGEFEITLSESVKIDGDLLTVLIELTGKKKSWLPVIRSNPKQNKKSFQTI